MQGISWINKGDIPLFRKRHDLAISCAQDYMQSVRNDAPEKRTNAFLSNCHRQRTIGSVKPCMGVTLFVWHLYSGAFRISSTELRLLCGTITTDVRASAQS
jgi:hypothetical protein